MNDQQEKVNTTKDILISCNEAATRLQFKKSKTILFSSIC